MTTEARVQQAVDEVFTYGLKAATGLALICDQLHIKLIIQAAVTDIVAGRCEAATCATCGHCGTAHLEEHAGQWGCSLCWCRNLVQP